MAESTNKATATPAATGGATLTPGAGAAASDGPLGVAGGVQSMDDFLDSKGLADGAEAPKEEDSAKGTLSGEERQPEEDEDRGTQGAGSREQGETEGDDEAEAGAESEESTGAAVEMGQFERGVLENLRAKGVPESLQKRIAKSFEKEIKNRAALAEREEMLGSKDAEIETLKTQLGEVASKATLAPSGPLAYLDSQEKVDEAHAVATNNLEWIEHPPSNWRAHFPEDGDEVPEAERLSSEQKLEMFKKRNIEMLKLLPAQAKVVSQRAAGREKLKAAKPTLFQPEHEDAKSLLSWYATDPRTRVDADEVFRLYLKAKTMEEEEARGDAKYHRVDLKATTKAKPAGAHGNGNGNGNGNGHRSPPHGENASSGSESESRKSSINLPAPKSHPRVPLKREGKDPLEQLEARAKTTGFSWEDYVDAKRNAAATN